MSSEQQTPDVSFDNVKYWKNKSYSPEITQDKEFQQRVKQTIKQLLLQEAINRHLEEQNKNSK